MKVNGSLATKEKMQTSWTELFCAWSECVISTTFLIISKSQWSHLYPDGLRILGAKSRCSPVEEVLWNANHWILLWCRRRSHLSKPKESHQVRGVWQPSTIISKNMWSAGRAKMLRRCKSLLRITIIARCRKKMWFITRPIPLPTKHSPVILNNKAPMTPGHDDHTEVNCL